MAVADLNLSASSSTLCNPLPSNASACKTSKSKSCLSKMMQLVVSLYAAKAHGRHNPKAEMMPDRSCWNIDSSAHVQAAADCMQKADGGLQGRNQAAQLRNVTPHARHQRRLPPRRGWWRRRRSLREQTKGDLTPDTSLFQIGFTILLKVHVLDL